MVSVSSETETRKKAGGDVSAALFLYWILPVLAIAVISRFFVDSGPAFLPPARSAIPLTMEKVTSAPTSAPSAPAASKADVEKRKPEKQDRSSIGMLANKPAGYQEVVKAIGRRRLDWDTVSTGGMTIDSVYPGGSSSGQPYSVPVQPLEPNAPDSEAIRKDPEKSSETPPTPRGASTDPQRLELVRLIGEYRSAFHADRSNIFKALALGDALRMHDVQYHDGGSMQEEAIATYLEVIKLASTQRDEMKKNGEETNRASTGIVDVNEEIMMDYQGRSIDGILCATYTALGKTYFMANMFEKAVETYSKAIEVYPAYLDAVSARGSSRIILGQYQEAAQDFNAVILQDTKRRFLDVFTGLARVLQAREDVVPEGWEPMVAIVNNLVSLFEDQVDKVGAEGRKILSNSLARLYHVLYNYHDAKTNNTDAAWDSLTKAYHYKMSILPPWRVGFEAQKIQVTKNIFQPGFWPKAGSASKAPIFIIGFVRSGSTLLERVLDAHPQIVGTGENSVFNGNLDTIRNKVVETSMKADAGLMERVIEELAEEVIEEMKERWTMVASAEDRAAGQQEPARYVDKMLTNYYNVGFIHMLFPNALILHVAREPMDTAFSAYKHDFPPGPLDYTSSFDSLAELYHAYRDVIEHWDEVLPGRITHVRYEDLVNDMEGVARGIIDATGLEWNDDILSFHKKKQAVNTLSTTQVRKGIYKDSMQAWRKYEKHLKPLEEKLGSRASYPLKTSLKNYKPPTLATDEL